MLVKVSELKDSSLDWAVAKCEGLTFSNYYSHGDNWKQCSGFYNYSTNWAQGGPIIEREIIMLDYDSGFDWDNPWIASIENTPKQVGPTRLIAAMRCYVASKLGEVVEIPDEIL